MSDSQKKSEGTWTKIGVLISIIGVIISYLSYKNQRDNSLLAKTKSEQKIENTNTDFEVYYEEWKSRIKKKRKNNSYYEVKLKNHCDEKIYVAIIYLDLEDNWIRDGWWGIEPKGESSTNVYTDNSNIYFYSKNAKNSISWNGNGKDGSVKQNIANGRFYAVNGNFKKGINLHNVSFFKKQIKNKGTYVQSFSCN